MSPGYVYSEPPGGGIYPYDSSIGYGTYGDTSMNLEPGMYQAIAEEEISAELYIADLQAEIDRLQIAVASEGNAVRREELQAQIRQFEQELDLKWEQLNQQRLTTELQLANSPIDFVAYEQYKRSIKEKGDTQQALYDAEQAKLRTIQQAGDELTTQYQAGQMPQPMYEQLHRDLVKEYQTLEASSTEREGFAPYSAPRTDEEIQSMLAEMTGVSGGAGLTGEFGAYIPTTQQFTRSGFKEISPDEMKVLASFLRAGSTPYGETGEVSLDPNEYFREMEEGFVPYMRETGPTQYKF